MAKRVFLIVLDSFGIGNAPDSQDFGDKGANTLGSVCVSEKFNTPNLFSLGLSHIDGVECGERSALLSRVARLCEKSRGKDTTIGHWEIAGVVSENPLPVFPQGFPQELLDRITKKIGRGFICNKPYSGTQVIADYGKEHLQTGKLIVYTSADSVFQIAAHEDIVPVDELYSYCEAARELLQGEYGVGRVIARPFEGEHPFKRTQNRHDFSLVPPKETMLDRLSAEGFDVIGVGKINDIFAGKGITKAYRTGNNAQGMEITSRLQNEDFNGLCFVNLVDFDMVYGHRNDTEGYADALTEFDRWLGGFLKNMKENDALIITADHGCDPDFPGTDHTRECTPFIMYGKGITPENLGTLTGFDFVAECTEKYLQEN